MIVLMIILMIIIVIIIMIIINMPPPHLTLDNFTIPNEVILMIIVFNVIIILLVIIINTPFFLTIFRGKGGVGVRAKSKKSLSEKN